MNKQSIEVSGGRETYYVYRDCEVKKGDFVEIMESGVAAGDSKPTEEVTTYSGVPAAYFMDSLNLTDNRILITFSSTGYQNTVCACLDIDLANNTVTQKSTGALDSSAVYKYFNSVKISDTLAVLVFDHYNATNVCGAVISISSAGKVSVLVSHTVIVSGSGYCPHVSSDFLEQSGSYYYVVIGYYMSGSYYLYQTYATTSNWKSSLSSSSIPAIRSLSEGDCDVCTMTTSRVIFTYSGSGTTYVRLCSITGTTSSYGGTFGNLQETTFSGEATHIEQQRLTATTMIMCYNYNSRGYYRLVTLNGNSFTLGGAVQFHNGALINTKIMKITDNKIVVTYDGGARVIFIKSNGSVVVGDEYKVLGTNVNPSFIDDGNILMTWHDGNSVQSQVLFLSQDVFIEESVVPMAYEKQVRPATTATPYGLALSSGMGGDYSEHKDTVIIAVPDNKGSSGTVVTKYEDIMPKHWQENVEGIDYSSNTEVVITAPTYRSSTTKLSNAFDGNASTAYHAALGQPIDVKIYFPRPVKINKAKIKIQSGSSSMPFSIVGSVDDISYDTLYTGYDRSSLDEITLTSPGYYQIYKIHKDGDSSAWHSLSEFQTTEYQIIE